MSLTSSDPSASLECKLRAFAAGLDDTECEVLFQILQTAQGATVEVSGFDANAGFQTPPLTKPQLASLLSNLANMRHEMLKSVANNLRA